MKLSAEMVRCLNYISDNGGCIYRYQGGFWAKEGWVYPARPYYRTVTIKALHARGEIKFTAHKEGRIKTFPIKAEIPPNKPLKSDGKDAAP